MPFLSNAIAGNYQMTWGGSSVGQVKDGIVLSGQPSFTQELADLYGDLIIDGVYRGVNYFLRFTIVEHNAQIVDMMHPFATLGTPGLAGRFIQDIAKAVVMTPTASTPAASSTPAWNTITASKCIPMTGFSNDVNFATRQREFPIYLLCLPWSDSGTIRCVRFA